jgi:hypothetical protein
MQRTKENHCKANSLLSDLRFYFFDKPSIQTLVQYNTPTDRENFSQRILQRIGVRVDEYSVLNIHKIGINVPVKYVFEELQKWDGNSSYWPNRIAHVKRINGKLENILIYFLGLEQIRFWKLEANRFQIKPLFNMTAIKFQHTPSYSDADNARYLLYYCSGGYPIGIFSLYVRSSIVEQYEFEKAQLFSLVAFNFYGRKNWFYSEVINPIWTKIHNRVTSNVLNRMKSEFENNFMTQVIGFNNTMKLENLEL